MGLGEDVERALFRWRKWRSGRLPGPLGAWHREGGEARLWEGLPVGPDALVLDVGGYRGDWTAEALVRFGCRSITFEAVPAFAEALRARYRHNARVEVVAGALGGAAGSLEIFQQADGSSAFVKRGEPVRVPLLDVAEVFAQRKLDQVACAKLNIEGGEFDLLDRWLAAGLAPRTASFVIQFHEIDAQSAPRREAIRAGLAKTHRLVVDYPFVWERWDRL
jgi:FkbM family methyltransferase